MSTGRRTLALCVLALMCFLQTVNSRAVRRSYRRLESCADYQLEIDGECYDVSAEKLHNVLRSLCSLFNDLGEEANSICDRSVPDKTKRFFGHTGFGK